HGHGRPLATAPVTRPLPRRQLSLRIAYGLPPETEEEASRMPRSTVWISGRNPANVCEKRDDSERFLQSRSLMPVSWRVPLRFFLPAYPRLFSLLTVATLRRFPARSPRANGRALELIFQGVVSTKSDTCSAAWPIARARL